MPVRVGLQGGGASAHRSVSSSCIGRSVLTPGGACGRATCTLNGGGIRGQQGTRRALLASMVRLRRSFLPHGAAVASGRASRGVGGRMGCS